jgi:hypothetical protein
MGRRSRKRGAGPVRPAAERPVVAAPPRQGPVRRRAKLDEAPKAPWHPFPLVELAILAGMILLVVGYLSDGTRREILFVGGLALVCLASLELVVREHFAGYRSHTSLLALATGFLVAAPVYVLGASRPVTVAVGLGVAGLAFWVLRAVFSRQAEGMTWRA